MIKKIVLITTLSLSLLANDLIVKGNNKMVRTQNPLVTQRVYLGSFLAKGHLPANKVYRIDTPLEGVVKVLNTNIYEHAKKGDLLAIIKSPKMLELEAVYINLLIEEEYNANELARLQPLYKAAVVSKKQYLKAKNTLEKYKTQAQFYYHLLQEWGLSKKQVESISRTKKPIPEIKIYAPIDGKIADLNIFPKMYLQRGEHMMTLLNADGTHLEVALPLYISKKLEAGFKLYIDDMPVIVEAIATQIDVGTQTLSVHLLPEDPMYILPNEKKNVKLFWPKKAFELPASSLIEYKNKPALFVEMKKAYKLLYVTVLGRSSSKVYIESKDLKITDKVVTRAAISLKGALEGQNND